ncbi:MAG: MFS transporter [Burkholderiales bacterium]|nr:MFS transporter [Burkholderiales bacterium]
MSADRRSVLALFACQALLTVNNLTIISVGSLAGFALAPDKSWSTLPATTYIAAGALSTYPISQYMRRHGRRAGFTLGILAGMLGAAISTVGVWFELFWVFCLGTFVAGAYTASGGYYRFAAADAAAPNARGRAISLVLAGGLAGGILGPESTKFTRDLLSATFLASYAALMLFAMLALLIVRTLELPQATSEERTGSVRGLGTLVRQPVFAVACLGAVSAYAVMNLLMGATPLAMQICGLPYASAAMVIQWHVVGMYAPALVMGNVVQRFGPLRVMLAGVCINLGCVAAAISGQTTMHFWLSGLLLGVGWCALFVGATALLTHSYAPAEKARAQGTNDVAVFVVMGASSAVSGGILYRLGWNWLNYTALPLLAATAIAVLWLAWSRSGRSAMAAAPAK